MRDTDSSFPTDNPPPRATRASKRPAKPARQEVPPPPRLAHEATSTEFLQAAADALRELDRWIQSHQLNSEQLLAISIQAHSATERLKYLSAGLRAGFGEHGAPAPAGALGSASPVAGS